MPKTHVDSVLYFQVEGFLAASIAEHGSTILSKPGMAQLFAPDGVLLQKGDVAHRKTLAQVSRSPTLLVPFQGSPQVSGIHVCVRAQMIISKACQTY